MIKIDFDLGNVRLRVPWPGSSRHSKDSPPNQSPSQVGVVDFAPTSPTSYLFPKQPKIPSTPRRLPRKKSLRKSKVFQKKKILNYKNFLIFLYFLYFI